jgi:hypothetical protein
MTLIELLVTTVLMGVVMCGVGTALYQALQVPAEGQARSVSANDRTYATTTLSDDIANATIIKTLKAGSAPTDPAELADHPNEYIVASTCRTTPANDDLLRLSNSVTSIDYRLLYAADAPNFATVKLQRNKDSGGWATLVSGYCKLSPADQVLDVLTISSGADGDQDPENAVTPWYVGRRVRAAFHFRDTLKDTPTLVDVEASPRTDCRPAADQLTKAPFDPTLPNCERS